MLSPSTPAAPLLACTLCQDTFSVVGAITLSIRLYHLPPLTPLSSADSMRGVQIEASTHDRSRRLMASAPCVALSALAVLVCLGPSVTYPPSYPPSLGPVLLPVPPATLRRAQRYNEGSDSWPARTRPPGLTA